LTTKGVFKFLPETKELYLTQIHPGGTVDDVPQDVPWDLKITPDLTETEPPTEAEINFIRHFAPGEVAGRNLRIELGLANLNRKAQRCLHRG
jgi:glutaconate CoA-transferase, subunit B